MHGGLRRNQLNVAQIIDKFGPLTMNKKGAALINSDQKNDGKGGNTDRKKK